jgi:TPR repeat protein
MFVRRQKFLASLAFVAAIAAAPAAHAEDSQDAVIVTAAQIRAEMADKYAEGLQLRAAGKTHGAFLAFQDAAMMGHPKAQRRLGEIYDAGDMAVRRDYLLALRWYQAAREQGEDIPVAGNRGYGPFSR